MPEHDAERQIKFVGVLQDVLHREIILHDDELAKQLNGIEPESIKGVLADNATYVRRDGAYFHAPMGAFNGKQFVTTIMRERKIGYAGAVALMDSIIDTQHYEMLYGRLEFKLHGGAFHNVYYFMGTARKQDKR